MAKKTTKKKTAKKRKKTKKKTSSGAIGKWGNLKFTIASKKRKTFDDLQWTTSIRFDTKDRKKKVSKLKFKGIDPDQISFSIRLSVFAGVNPLAEINSIDKTARKGKANRLIIGGKKYGSHKWAITGITKECKYFDKKGHLWVTEVKITMKEKV